MEKELSIVSNTNNVDASSSPEVGTSSVSLQQDHDDLSNTVTESNSKGQQQQQQQQHQRPNMVQLQSSTTSMTFVHHCDDKIQSNWRVIEIILRDRGRFCKPSDLEGFDLTAVATVRESLEGTTRKDAKQQQQHQCLLRVAINSQVPPDVIDQLLCADAKGRSILEKDVLQDLLCDYPIRQDWMDLYLAKPLLDFLMQSSIHENQNKIRLYMPDAAYSFLATSIVRSQNLKETLTNHTIARSVVALFFLELFMHIFLITFFVVSTNFFLIGLKNADYGILETDHFQESMVYLSLLSGMILIDICRECSRISSRGIINYFFNGWDWVNFLKIICLVFSTITMIFFAQTNYSTGLLSDEINHKTVLGFLVVTAGLLYLSFISFLRYMFLSFATFLSGTMETIRCLFPFFVVITLVVLMFTYMYYVQRYEVGIDEITGECDQSDPDNFCTYGQSFLNVFSYLAGGPDNISDWLDIVCGVFVVIIFLNVLIAIVTESWTTANATRSKRSFWEYRIKFLCEIRPLVTFLRRFSPLEEPVDQRLERLSSCLEEAKLEQHHQLKKERSKKMHFTMIAIIIKVLFLGFIKYVVLFLLGIVTLGFFWPRDTRYWLFCDPAEDGEMGEEESDDNNNNDNNNNNTKEEGSNRSLVRTERIHQKKDNERLKETIDTLEQSLLQTKNAALKKENELLREINNLRKIINNTKNDD